MLHAQIRSGHDDFVAPDSIVLWVLGAKQFPLPGDRRLEAAPLNHR
jgi:hypothetical protein